LNYGKIEFGPNNSSIDFVLNAALNSRMRSERQVGALKAAMNLVPLVKKRLTLKKLVKTC
jgi:hypothetical protein